MKRGLLTTGAMAIAAVLFVSVVILSNTGLKGVRADLTQAKLYTLSEGTKHVLAGLKEPLTFRFFFSEKLSNQLPQIRTYGTRVRELLEEYAAQSKGKIRLQLIDPEPFSDAEDRAVEFGMQGVPLSSATGEQFYFGLAATNTVNDTQTVPFFQQEREQFLEYELTRLVQALSDAKKPVVGLMTQLPMQGGPVNPMQPTQFAPPWVVMQQMNQLFEVRTLTADLVKVPEEIKVLVLVHPRELPEPALYAIDQFVMRGGRVLLFLDPNAEVSASSGRPPMMGMPPMTDGSSLAKLPDAWGFSFDESKFVGDRRNAIRVNAGRGGRRQIVDFVAWHQIPRGAISVDDPVTGELSNLVFASPGALAAKAGASTKFQPLVTSSRDAALIDANDVRMMPDPEKLLRDFVPSGDSYVLAARVTGPAKSAFAAPPDRPAPKEGQAAPADWPEARDHVAESRGPINLIVIADVDMLEDRFWVQTQEFFGERLMTPTAGNGGMVVNAIDNLLGSNELISLRSRGRSQRPFTLILDIRKDAEVRFRAEEQALQKKLEEAQKQMAELQKAQGGQGAPILTPEQRQAIEQFRAEVQDTRKALRDVQYRLQADIEALATRIKLLNIGLVPALVAAVAVALWLVRRQRRLALRAAAGRPH